MSFSSLYHFFRMGGYAVYVWPAYAFVLISLITHAGIVLRKLLVKKEVVDSHESDTSEASLYDS